LVAAGWDGGVDSSSSSPPKFGWDALLAAAAIALAGFGIAGPEEGDLTYPLRQSKGPRFEQEGYLSFLHSRRQRRKKQPHSP
jgi:hypothetical protein